MEPHGLKYTALIPMALKVRITWWQNVQLVAWGTPVGQHAYNKFLEAPR